MRFVWAVVSFLLAAVLIGAGVAQRTVFLGETSAQQKVEVTGSAPYTLIDAAVLEQSPGAQTLIVKGTGQLFASYGRTDDMTAWLADVDYNHVTLSKSGKVSSTAVPASESAPEVTEAQQKQLDAAAAAKQIVPQAGKPAGSDLWLDEYTDTDSLIKELRLTAGQSVLLATDGTNPAPADVTVSWSKDNATPWAGPLIVLGGIALLVGIVLYVLAIRHMRRGRGPRRRALPPLPETQPIATADAAAQDKGVVSTSSRRSRSGRRAFIALPLVAVTAVALSGCSSDWWPQISASTPTPTPSETVVAPEGQQAPAVTELQAQRIIDQVSQTLAAADEAKSADIAATRATGAALAERTANYTLRAALADEPATAPVPGKPYEIVLPQATDAWPRTMMAVWRDAADTTTPPRIMTLEQTDPWSGYKLTYIGQMEASAEIPALAPPAIGANLVPPNSNLLTIAPEKLAAAYADVLDKGKDSAYADLFDLENDAFAKKIAEGRTARLNAFNESAKEQDKEDTGSLTFSAQASSFAPIALQTVQSGALIAVSVDEVDLVKATDPDAVIKLGDNKRVEALAGTAESAKGFSITFGDQLFFSVPGRDSGEKIRLIGFSSSTISAEVIK
ncbi:hypothetical protein [Microbacterium gorillae]|uniref:hypothetical protein n=1 Tax=Microbacterium gorillae TaxID=1231063 RepID=UPI000AC35290|nr:hypothetical protein [Microbacterium gorillae]